jgi:DNA-binding transcriptional LysR family regulator
MPAGYDCGDPSASVACGGMNLRQLQYFVAVAEEGGFRQAAARVHVAQPALSRQIQAMESELGLVLLDRSSRRVALTPAGEAYVRAVGAVLRDVARSVRRARLASVGHVGRCVIAASRPALARSHLSRTAERVTTRFPEIELTITEADVPDQWEMLGRGDVDLVVGLAAPPEARGIAVEPLWSDTVRCALLPSDHPLAGRASLRLADLRGETIIVMEPALTPEMWGPVERALDRAGIAPPQRRTARSMSGMRALVAAGHGWSPVSDSYLEQPPTGTAVVALDDFSTEVTYAVQWRDDDRRGVVEVVRDVLHATCAGVPDEEIPVPAQAAAADNGDGFGLPRALELRHLEYLRAAVTAASIGGAAEALAIAQPVLSRQLRDLEQALGVELLERGRRGVRPTAAGDILVRETSRVAADLDDAVQAANRAFRGALGQCMLAAISTPMGIQVVASVLAECTRTDPMMAIEIVEIPTISQRTALLSATVDLGFSAVSLGTDLDASVVREHMLDDPLDCILVARDHPLAASGRIRLGELATLPFLFSSRDSHPAFHDQVTQQLARLGLRSPVDATFQSLHLRWSRAAEGKGWCLGFRSQRGHPPRGTVALDVDGLHVPWGMELLWRAGDDREMVAKLIASFRRASAVARRQPVLVR